MTDPPLLRDIDHLADVYCIPGVNGDELARALESIGWRPPVER